VYVVLQQGYIRHRKNGGDPCRVYAPDFQVKAAFRRGNAVHKLLIRPCKLRKVSA
jgi:hypothetical protein